MRFEINNKDINKNQEFINKKQLEKLLKLKKELNNTKSKIDNCVKDWNIVKKQINLYEYLYISSSNKNNISKIKPISRSYFKFIEINKLFNIVNTVNKNNIVCLCEAPGGFVQSILNMNHIDKDIIGISLLSKDYTIPKWNNTLKKNKNFTIENGIKNNGDICDLNNIISIINKIGRNKIDIVTGDGGFDYSNDYSKQEENSLKLILSEILIAINIQKIGGKFICKIFDIFNENTLKLLYILNILYEKITIYKPKTSRNSNSEKYLICEEYYGYNLNINNILCRYYLTNKIDINLSKDFVDEIINYNELYCNLQKKYINEGINIINNNKINNYASHNQIKLTVQWCKEHNIPLNNNSIYLNNT
jgi:23S rRNA U2552 (ribose-2'-O)-methylase RlmE/FtsJ